MLSFNHFSKQNYEDFLIIAHGLFGSKINWMTIAKFLSENLNYQIIVVDLRNHGSSFWSDNHNYLSMAQDLIELSRSFSKKVSLIGHSMGGKAAMYACLINPEIFKKLVVVDISPVSYLETEFVHYIELLEKIDLHNLRSRKEADFELKTKITNNSIRLFLLQNLFLGEDKKYKWKINLKSLKKNIENIKSFPKIQKNFEGSTLFIKGEKSSYILEEHIKIINFFFPRFILKEIKKSGHWPHVEQQKLFIKELLDFF
tara:strand:- start:829 stop:1599 length:771 start_codon:yes stop_codon:yes gene_type:complete